jgi:TRAP-type C4-dicarboxylate transport system permease small subunit
MGALRRLDAGAARLEAGLACAVLLAMMLVATVQAFSFNLAQREVSLARALLDQLTWADVFLQKGTLWLAFLGASLATHRDKHIGVDLFPRWAPGKAKTLTKSFAALGSGLIALLLSGVYFSACLVADAATPFEYEALGPEGPVHVCDASPADGSGSPALLCALRGALALVQVPVSSGSGIAQLIAPLMLAVIGMRLLGRGIGCALEATRGASSAAGDGDRSGAGP